MKRSIKNSIMIVCLIGLIGMMIVTIKMAGLNSSSKVPSIQHNIMLNQSNHSNSEHNKSPVRHDKNNDNQTTNNSPSRSDEDNKQNNTPTDKPSKSGNIQSNSTGNSSSTLDESNKKQSYDEQRQTSNMSNDGVDMIYYIVFGFESFIIAGIIIYLIMSKFNKKSLKDTFKSSDKALIYLLSIVILTSVLTFIDSKLVNSKVNSTEKISKDNIIQSGKKEVTKEETISDDISTSKSDESGIVVKDGGKAKINGSKIEKSGDTSNTENSDFHGVNAGILVTKGSKATIKKAKIKTSANGGNGVFATGTHAKVKISNSTIETTGDSSSRGLDATYGGTIDADNVKITTQGNSSAALATDRGEGTVSVSESTLETNGSGSPDIYSTGDISVTDTNGVANNSQMVVIEGANTATVISSSLKASGAGNRKNVDDCGVMIYQSMSGDASNGTGIFTAHDSNLTLTSTKAPFFFVTNTSAVINLENTKLSYNSNILLNVKGTSEWGEINSNGGDVIMNTTNQDLVGDIKVDSISTLELNLTKSTYKGAINTDNTAKKIKLKLDEESTITLTSDTYVTDLDDELADYSNINFNGYKLFVNGKAIN